VVEVEANDSVVVLRHQRLAIFLFSWRIDGQRNEEKDVLKASVVLNHWNSSWAVMWPCFADCFFLRGS
jgi:hypothetical protein